MQYQAFLSPHKLNVSITKEKNSIRAKKKLTKNERSYMYVRSYQQINTVTIKMEKSYEKGNNNEITPHNQWLQIN